MLKSDSAYCIWIWLESMVSVSWFVQFFSILLYQMTNAKATMPVLFYYHGWLSQNLAWRDREIRCLQRKKSGAGGIWTVGFLSIDVSLECNKDHLRGVLRSWVQIPPSPSFTTRELRHWFEFVLVSCWTECLAMLIVNQIGRSLRWWCLRFLESIT